MKSSSQIDIVVYGATGFTGQLVAEYLATQYRNDSRLKWAMAGRSLDKLKSVRDAIGAPPDTPLIVADASDPDSLKAMVAQANSVLTTVGPYQYYGSKLVALCAATGTDYLDLCGEPVWMRQMIDAHEATAKKSGARILFSCGYDSIPFELGVYFCQQTARQALGAPVARVKGRVRAMKGTLSGGTAASMRAIFSAAANDLSLVALLRNPFALTPGFEGPKQPPGNKPLYDEDMESWTTPFMMANINTRNVHRSNMLLGFPYGRDFVYDEMVLTGPGEQGEAKARRMLAANTSEKMGSGGPKPGEGPSKEERENGLYDLVFLGLAPDGRQARVAVRGDRDPGYGSTSKMIAECAIGLREAPDVAAGIWTPGAALGDRLIKRLVDHAGLTFTVEK